MNQRVESVLSDLQHRFRDLYGDRLIRLILFGSQARGEAVDGSDIDVLVVLEGPVDAGREIERTSEIRAELSLEHNTVVSCVYMDEDHFRTRNGPLLRNIRREGVPL